MKMIIMFNNVFDSFLLRLTLFGCITAGAAACGSSDAKSEPPVTFRETEVGLDLALDVTPATTGEAGSSGDGGSAGESSTVSTPATATLTITAHDGDTPIVTDLWLYNVDDADQLTQLTGFTSTAARKAPGLMLPATIGGKASGLSPADDGRANGLMTSTTRGKLVDGAFVSTVDGKVVVTLAAVPTSAIVVVAAVEDQRYGGAAAINVDGSTRAVPAGAFTLETHTEVSYARDVAPLVKRTCLTQCHNTTGPNGANMYLLDTQDHLVNDNFALTEDTTDCKADNASGSPELAACIQQITKAQFLVEPGAPAATDLLQRSRPDEDKGSSITGLAWFGGGTPKTRYNAKYGDRRMPSTTTLTQASHWTDLPTEFDLHPEEFKVLYDWVAQGAKP
jgi:hypothetical protein